MSNNELCRNCGRKYIEHQGLNARNILCRFEPQFSEETKVFAKAFRQANDKINERQKPVKRSLYEEQQERWDNIAKTADSLGLLEEQPKYTEEERQAFLNSIAEDYEKLTSEERAEYMIEFKEWESMRLLTDEEKEAIRTCGHSHDTPNQTTIDAINENKENTPSYKTVDELMVELNKTEIQDILVANGWKIEPFGHYSCMVGKDAYRVILPVWMLEASMDTNLSYEDYNLPEVIAPQRRSGMSFSGIKWLWNKVKGNK